MNQTINLINNRVSLRKYLDRPVSQEDRETVIQSALRAPTAGNMMLYSIIVVEDQEKKKVLSRTCDNQPFIARAPLVMIFLADLQRWYDYYRYCGVREYCEREGKDFTGPTEAELMLGCSDALIAAQTAVLAAESLGIGSCYIGDILENYKKHRELLSLPPWTFPIAMLVMGYYPEKRPEVRGRFDQEYIVFKDRYHRLSEAELEAMFSEKQKRFKSGNRFKADNPGQIVYARKTGSDFAEEMARSVREMLKNWQGEILQGRESD